MSRQDERYNARLGQIEHYWPGAMIMIELGLPFHAGVPGVRFSLVGKRGRYGEKDGLRAHLPADAHDAWRAQMPGLRDLVLSAPPIPEHVRHDAPPEAQQAWRDAWTRRQSATRDWPRRTQSMVTVPDPGLGPYTYRYRHAPQAARWIPPEDLARTCSTGPDPKHPLASGIWRRYVCNVQTTPHEPSAVDIGTQVHRQIERIVQSSEITTAAGEQLDIMAQLYGVGPRRVHEVIAHDPGGAAPITPIEHRESDDSLRERIRERLRAHRSGGDP